MFDYTNGGCIINVRPLRTMAIPARRDDKTDIHNEMFNRYMEYDPEVTAADLDSAYGYVYLLQTEHGYKIGKSVNPKSRIASLRTASSFKIHVLAVIYASKMGALERALHASFASKKIRGEWYLLDEADIAYIVGLDTKTIATISKEFIDEAVA